MNSWIVTPCSLWFRIVCPSRPFLGSSVLALALELCRRQEVVFVLERFDVVFLLERYKQEDMLPLTYETLPPKALGIRQSIEGCNISRRYRWYGTAPTALAPTGRSDHSSRSACRVTWCRVPGFPASSPNHCCNIWERTFSSLPARRTTLIAIFTKLAFRVSSLTRMSVQPSGRLGCCDAL